MPQLSVTVHSHYSIKYVFMDIAPVLVAYSFHWPVLCASFCEERDEMMTKIIIVMVQVKCTMAFEVCGIASPLGLSCTS